MSLPAGKAAAGSLALDKDKQGNCRHKENEGKILDCLHVPGICEIQEREERCGKYAGSKKAQPQDKALASTVPVPGKEVGCPQGKADFLPPAGGMAGRCFAGRFGFVLPRSVCPDRPP